MSGTNQPFHSETSQASTSEKKPNRIIAILSTLLAVSLAAIVYLYLQIPTSNIRTDQYRCSNICCDSPEYNFISEESLDTMICNYRNKEWWKTCDAFSQKTSFSHQIWKQHIKMATALRGSQASMYDSTYNSRYMDIGIHELENYLCTIRNNCGSNAKFLRFYFIRYGNECFKQAFANKHSLAMIPLDSALIEIPNAKDCNTTGDLAPLIMVSHIANHNEICPPEPPKGCSIRLNSLDSNAKTYFY